MSESGIYARILKSLSFDIIHVDATLVRAYLYFLRDFLSAKLCGKPNLSSESFHWTRFYHEQKKSGLPVNGEIKFKNLKDSIRYALNELTKVHSETLNLTEVGCGPTSQFWSEELANYPKVNIVTVDPLAHCYETLHKKYKTGYNIKCVEGYGETLDKILEKESFHLVYSQNAIDHSMSPERFINNLSKLLKPDGYLILNGFIKEGSAARWLGLHQWDIEFENGELLLTNRSKTVYRKSLTRHLPLTLISSEMDCNSAYTVIYKKLPSEQRLHE